MAHNDNMYYIWCRERNMWWKSRQFGYTSDFEEAGVYRECDAVTIIEKANSHGEIEDVMVPEEAIELIRNTLLHGT